MHARPDVTLILMELSASFLLIMFGFCYLLFIDPFSRHMLVHVALMTGIATLLAGWVHRRGWLDHRMASASTLAIITILQLVIFFAWHSPPGVRWMMFSPLGGAVMQLSLLGVAVFFWLSLFQQANSHMWRGILALVVTGKIFCLLGLVLVFAPNPLYAGSAAMAAHGHGMVVDIAGQQLAGILMLTACPMTYVLASVILIARWLRLPPDAVVLRA